MILTNINLLHLHTSILTPLLSLTTDLASPIPLFHTLTLSCQKHQLPLERVF